MTVADIEPMVQLWTDSVVTRYMGGPRDKTKISETFREILLEENSQVFDLYPLIDNSLQKLVGHCGLIEKNIDSTKEIEVNYIIEKASWGKGYATEIAKALCDHAFKVHYLNRVVALINPKNLASERVAQKIGMSFVKETQRPNGVTMKVYSLLR